MLEYEILKYPDSRLFKKSEEVDNTMFNTDILRNIIDRMFYTMHLNEGIGLAAPQVNIHKRIIVIRFDRYNLTLINPTIISKSENLQTFKEGCLSVPNLNANVKRPKEIEIEYYNIQGEKQQLKAEGLLSTCIQHEIDHLNGVVYIDRLSNVNKYLISKKIKKLKSNNLNKQ
jgi:peptide deformylase